MTSSTSLPEIVLIDAYSQIFRAFYAIRELNNSRGEPVNALFVFTRLLLTIERNFPGEAGAMLFDCGKVDFRLSVAPEYKANRPPMPDPLQQQIPAIREISAAFGWPLIACKNFEADDLIGAFCRACSGRRIAIISSDKDLSQLVDENITLLAPASRGFEPRNREWVQNKFGVPPELIADYLALTGDSVDNIPGIPGIGPKSAVELLLRFGPLESWLDHPQTTLAGTRFAARFNSDSPELLRRNLLLTRLRTELPDEMRNPGELLQRRSPDWKRIREICETAEFRSLLRELPEPDAATDSAETGELFSTPAEPPAELPETGRNEPPTGGNFVQGELF